MSGLIWIRYSRFEMSEEKRHETLPDHIRIRTFPARWLDSVYAASSHDDDTGTSPAQGGAEAIGIFEGHQDVGTVRHPGSVEYDAAGRRFTVAGSGANMWAARDAFHYVWKKTTGDLALTADVSFLGTGTELHRKACLVIRQCSMPTRLMLTSRCTATG